MRALSVMVLFSVSACRDVPHGHRLEGALTVPAELPACSAAADVFCGVESRAPLFNPHQGFQRFEEATPRGNKAPPTRVSYSRFWWGELEPSPGAIDFKGIDDALAAANARGETFAFRVMPEPAEGDVRPAPSWLSGAYDSPAFIEAAERTIAALGARYDGDARLDHVDVGFVGGTGEWAQVAEGASFPSAETTTRLLDAFTAAFPRTPVLMNVGAVDDEAKPLSAALARGMGWRLDCWGDLREPWNHHDDFYEQRLEAAKAFDTWKTAPVAVETCGDMELWDTLGYEPSQVRWLLKWALDHHVSFINNKSRTVPDRFRPAVDEYLGFAGARIYVHRAERTAGALRLAVLNRGSTPPLHAWRLGVRLRGSDTVTASQPLTHLIDAVEVTLALPAGAGPLEVALLDEQGTVLQLANSGARDDGWVELFP